jgi:hypothetical protein
MIINVLCLGDVVSTPGCEYLAAGGRLKKLRDAMSASLVIANGENSANGNGITPASADALKNAGVDIITGGNHTWRRKEIFTRLDDDPDMVRPANYHPSSPGMGYTVTVTGEGVRVLVINLMGTVYIEGAVYPWQTADDILRREEGKYDVSVIDIHAEATSEKLFIGRYFDGRVSAVFGTHTHVATADATVLPGGTGYITDVGMCGSMNGILGVKTENIIRKFTTGLPTFFEPSTGDEAAHGVLFCLDSESGRCIAAQSVEF